MKAAIMIADQHMHYIAVLTFQAAYHAGFYCRQKYVFRYEFLRRVFFWTQQSDVPANFVVVAGTMSV